MVDLQDELTRIAALVDDYLLPRLASGRPKTLWEAAAHLPKMGGKKLRPFLTINVCKALRGREEDALPVGAAVELIQAFSLVHDDIIDNDLLRRGGPTVHSKWGNATAIVAGDLLHAKSYDLLTEAALQNPTITKILPNLLKELNIGTIRMCEGQQMDEELERSKKPSEQFYLEMIEKKTAALFEVSTVMGAMLATPEQTVVEEMRLFGRNLGIGFQIADDILGLVADEKELGKPVGSDIREGKNTILVIHALSNVTQSSRRIILKALGNKKATAVQLKAAIREISASGAVEYAYQKAKRLEAAAVAQLSPLPDTEPKRLLKDALEFVLSRRY
ncbi:MAG: polyprenyl synthetase family protein [archaeon]